MLDDREIFMRWLKRMIDMSDAIERARPGIDLDTGEPELYVTTLEGREFVLSIREG